MSYTPQQCILFIPVIRFIQKGSERLPFCASTKPSLSTISSLSSLPFLSFCRWIDSASLPIHLCYCLLFVHLLIYLLQLTVRHHHLPFTMLSREVLLAVLAALSVSAVPLNINLGAYSPALVVGDGEISFGGSPERASELLQTLATGAVNGAVANGQQPPRPAIASPVQAGTLNGAPPAPAAPANSPTGAGIASPLVAPTLSEQKPETPDSNTPASSPLQAVEGLGSGSTLPTEYISHAMTGTKFPNMARTKRSLGRRSVAEFDPKVEAAKQKIRRDIDGFREALAFARDAQKNSPKIVMGQGITQFPGSNVPAASAANGALPPGGQARPEKRDVEDEPVEKLGMTLIAISEI
jgi:hypothetical protein